MRYAAHMHTMRWASGKVVLRLHRIAQVRRFYSAYLTPTSVMKLRLHGLTVDNCRVSTVLYHIYIYIYIYRIRLTRVYVIDS